MCIHYELLSGLSVTMNKKIETCMSQEAEKEIRPVGFVGKKEGENHLGNIL
jgi:hypothetical protein